MRLDETEIRVAEPIANSRSAFRMMSLRLRAVPALAASLLLCSAAARSQQNGPPSSGTSSSILFVPATLNPISGFNPVTGALDGPGYSGDGMLANSSTSQFYNPVGIAYDSNGNLFIADSTNHIVRRIDHATGILSTFAGTPGTFGSSPFAGPGPATSATLGNLAGLVVDSNNNVYVSDRNNNAVWKITPGGTISTFAGGASVLCSQNTDSLGDGCPATQATLSNPWALGIDANNNIYIADSYNDLIRKVSSTTGVISVFAGVVADAGNYGNCNANLYAVSGSGPFLPTQAHLCFPQGIAFDGSGNTYISDTTRNLVRIINSSGYISTFAGGGTGICTGVPQGVGDGCPAKDATLHDPAGLYVDPAGRVYISDFFNGEIRVVDSTGIINDVMGSTHGGLNNGSIGEPDTESFYNATVGAESGSTDGVYSFLLDPYGNILAADSAGNAITSAGTTGQYFFGNTNQIYQTATTTSLNAGSNLYPPYITISNPSGVTLNFTGTPVVTTLTPAPTPAAFAISGGTCTFPGSLAPGASCTVVVSFTPTTDSTYTGTIVLDSNSNTSPNTILLSGKGTGTCTNSATLTTPLSFTSPPNVTSATKPVTLSNTGICPISTNLSSATFINNSPSGSTAFSLVSNNCPATLNGGQTCTLNVAFTPPALAGYTSQIELDIPTVGNVLSYLYGTGITAPAVSFNPAQINFLPTSANTAATAISTVLTNVGNAPLNNLVVSLTGPNSTYFAFSGTNNCASSVAAGAFCTISVNFTPQTGTTNYAASISVADNAAGSPQTVPLTGSLSSAPLTATINLTDTIHFTDTPVLSPSTLLNDAETVHITDGVPTLSSSLALSIAEQLHITDTVPTLSPSLLLSIAEQLNFTDTPTLSPSLLLNISEQLNFTDSSPAKSLKPSTLLLIGEALQLTDSSPTSSLIPSTLLSIGESLHFGDTNSERSATTIDWPSPAAIMYPAPLSSKQLDATASTAGTFVYTPPSGTILQAGTHQLSVSFTPSDLNFYTTATGSTTLNVNAAPLTLTAHDATRVYGAISPAFSGTITGAVNGDVLTETFSTTATLLSTPGNYPIIPSVSGTNVGSYNVSTVDGTLTVNQASTTLALSASTATSLAGSQVTLTASVQPAAAGAPAGSVTFFDGAVSLGSAPLSGGAASLTTTQLPSGADSLTAVYSGDADFVGSTSNAVTVTVGDFDLKVSLSSLTLPPGGTGTLTFTVTPDGGAFGLPIVFTATGLPPGATATFNPSSVTPGSGPVTVTVTVTAPPLKARNDRSSPIGSRTGIALGALLPWIALLSVRRARRNPLRSMLLAVFCFGAALGMSSCTNAGFFTQPPQSYTVTVTASSSAAVHSTTFQLTVE